MLYKKIHRQYLRQFRIGRRFKYKFCGCSEVCKVTKKLYIDDENFVNVSCIGKDNLEYTYSLVCLSYPAGRILYNDREIILLD